MAVAVITKRHGIDKVPATVPLAGDKDFGIRVFGLHWRVRVRLASRSHRDELHWRSALDPAVEGLAQGIRRPTHTEIRVTLTLSVLPEHGELGPSVCPAPTGKCAPT